MGSWGTELFADDAACDIRDFYVAMLGSGAEDFEALQRTEEKFRADLFDTDSGGVLWIALAITQSKLGRLDSRIRDHALAAIDSGGDIATWELENPRMASRRRVVFRKAREQLTGPQPELRKPRKRRLLNCGLVSGDVLSLNLECRVVLLRVVALRKHQHGDTPVLEELAFEGAIVPDARILAELPARTEGTLNMATSNSHRFLAYQGRDWETAGFQKLGSFPTACTPRGDSIHVDTGWTWTNLANRIRDKRATTGPGLAPHLVAK